MRVYIYILVLLLISSMKDLQAQDVVFTQSQAASLYQNISYTGFNAHKMRAQVAYRQQWLTIGLPYTTTYAGFDASFFDQQPIGIGMHILREKAGEAPLQNTQVNLSASYLKLVSRRKDIYFSFGLQVGIVNQSFDYSKAIFDNQYDGIEFNTDIASNEVINEKIKNGFNAGAGVSLHNQIRERKYYTIGLNVDHITTYKISYLEDGTTRKAPRFSLLFNGNFPVDVSLKYAFVPYLHWVWQGGMAQANIGAGMRLTPFGQHKDRKSFLLLLHTRLTNRLGKPIAIDAIMPEIRLEYNDKIFIGMSYDVNISKLIRASSSVGAGELSLGYLFGKKSKNKGLF